MNKIRGIFKLKKVYLAFGLIALGALALFIFRGGGNEKELYTVKRENVTQSVILSGVVQTSARADLGFAAAGRVASIFVKNNEAVKKGRVLAQLEIGDLLAELKIKQANLQTSNSDLDTKVENTYRELLSTGLVLTPSSQSYTQVAPTVTGLYDGGKEGEYKVIIDQDGPTQNDYSLRIFGIESMTTTISNKTPTALGTGGLYLTFPGNDPAPYNNTIWYLDIPNKKSASYLESFNAYQEAKKERDAAYGGAPVDQVAQGEIDKINAEIRKNTIYAPFSGKVTNIEKEVGENASIGERVISILGEGKLEVVLKVSELDVSRIIPNTSIEITLDAFPGEKFAGVLETINSRETTVDGVPVYEAFVTVPADPRIKTGMSASGKIVIATKENVLTIPLYFVTKTPDLNTVLVVNEEGKTQKRTIALGLVGTDSMVEVTGGLEVGERISYEK